MTSSPPSIDLDGLFVEPRMFDTRDAFRAAGFEVKRGGDMKIMVGRHPSVPDYLFKKFPSDVPREAQRDNYELRVTGARMLKLFIEEHALQHIVVPQKWIVSLPSIFTHHKRPAQLLIVERIDIIGNSKDVARRYRDIDKDTLEELCRVVYRFRGLDSGIHNVRFTNSGQIAFIDTENWKWKKDGFLQRLQRDLSKSSRKHVKRTYKKLRAER